MDEEEEQSKGGKKASRCIAHAWIKKASWVTGLGLAGGTWAGPRKRRKEKKERAGLTETKEKEGPVGPVLFLLFFSPSPLDPIFII